MSLQDDYYDLDASLKGNEKKQLRRIWKAFCELEAEQEPLLRFRNSFNNMIDAFDETMPIKKIRK